MAILTSRAIQDLILDSAAFLTDQQGQDLVRRLNRTDDQALQAEWELIILSALSRDGILVHEPELGGSRKLDFSFEHSESGMRFVGDVTMLSDDSTERDPTDFFVETLIARLRRDHVHGQLSIRLDREQVGNKVRPRLPHHHELSRFVFGVEFQNFVRRVRANPGATHQSTIQNPKAGFSIAYAPGPSRISLTGIGTKMPRDLNRNIVRNALEKKNDQIRHSGHAQGDGCRCLSFVTAIVPRLRCSGLGKRTQGMKSFLGFWQPTPRLT